MNQYYICVVCGAENDIDIELSTGESQELTCPCAQCGRANLIVARYNYALNEFELEISPAEDDG
jgi:DNA-directed RNA polymerase subunit RPC12/RpoP